MKVLKDMMTRETCLCEGARALARPLAITLRTPNSHPARIAHTTPPHAFTRPYHYNPFLGPHTTLGTHRPRPACLSEVMVSLAAPVAALPSATVKAAITGPSLKRKHSDSDSDNEGQMGTAIKRPRVSFDPNVDIRLLEDYNEKGIELIREEVRRAIDKHVAGDSASYDEIKTLFKSRPTASAAPSTKLLSKYVVALIGNVSLLNKNCSGLVHAILDCQWLARDEAFKRLYVTLLASLMSAHGGYTGSVLQSLAKHFYGGV